MLPRSRCFGAAIGPCRPKFRFGRPVLIESKASRAVQSCDAPLSEPSPACSGETSSLAQEGLCPRNGNRDRSFPRHAALGPYDVLKLLPESEVNPIRRSRSEAMG